MKNRLVSPILFIALLGILVLSGCGGDSGNEGGDSPAKDTSAPQNTTIVELPTGDTSIGDNSSDDAPQLAAIVNGDEITLAEFQREVNILQTNQTFQPADVNAFETEVLQMMIDQILIDQYATQNNLDVTNEEVAQEVATLRDLANQNDMQLTDIIGYPEDMIEDKVRETLISQSVSRYVTENVPINVTQIHARHILVKDEALAFDLLRQLNEGASFSELALRNSQDPSTAPTGGDLGWVSRGDLLQQEVEDVIFQMPVNSRWPEPVQSILGYHLIESLERVDDRPLDETRRAERRQELFSTWLEDLRESASIVRFVGDNASSNP